MSRGPDPSPIHPGDRCAHSSLGLYPLGRALELARRTVPADARQARLTREWARVDDIHRGGGGMLGSDVPMMNRPPPPRCGPLLDELERLIGEAPPCGRTANRTPSCCLHNREHKGRHEEPTTCSRDTNQIGTQNENGKSSRWLASEVFFSVHWGHMS